MANQTNMRMLILVAIVLLFLGMQNTVPKEYVSCVGSTDPDCLGVEGRSCSTDADCPCWGTVPGTEVTAYGIGTAKCKDGFCDTTYCFDVQPIGEWIRDTPWAWMKDNPLIVMLFIGLILVYAFYPI